ncbi:MAG: hypothetical protein M0017_02760, partial [Desulfobacteraceae bacterium]|nr:hypothetical protein [Desulfobacteraceae bacterium]
LDEPFSALDAPLRQRMRLELLEIRKRFAVPLVVITHDPADVEVFGDTLVIFEHGRVAEVKQREGLPVGWGRKVCHLTQWKAGAAR